MIRGNSRQGLEWKARTEAALKEWLAAEGGLGTESPVPLLI